MNQASMQQAAEMILTTSIEALARVHKCSVEQIEDGLRAEHPRLMEQFARLVAEGCKAAADTMADRMDILEAVTMAAPVGV